MRFDSLPENFALSLMLGEGLAAPIPFNNNYAFLKATSSEKHVLDRLLKYGDDHFVIFDVNSAKMKYPRMIVSQSVSIGNRLDYLYSSEGNGAQASVDLSYHQLELRIGKEQTFYWLSLIG